VLKFIADLRIGVKILVMAGLAVLLTALVGLTGQSTARTVQNTGARIVNVTAQRSQTSLILRGAWADYRGDMTALALASTQADTTALLTDLDSKVQVINTGVTQLQSLGLSASESSVLKDEVLPNFAAATSYWTKTLKPIATGLNSDYAKFTALLESNFNPAADKVETGLSELSVSADKAMDQQVKAAGSKTTKAVIRIWLFTGIGALLLIVLALWITAMVSRPLGLVRDALRALAKGDLTMAVNVTSKDEAGQMAEALTDAQTSLREALREINDTSATLSSSAEELSAVSAQISTNAQETSSRASSLAGTANEVSSNVQTVAAGTEEMTASIREIASSSAEAVRVAASAVNEASVATKTVSKLGDSSVEIGNVIKVITSIAEQTNLLALNATIEAARAGEAGKGFAVVAEEVKQLAQETARATEDISKRVQAIQGDTQEAVGAIDRISQTIQDVNAYQTTIASAVEEQTATTSEISRSVTEAAGGSASIADSVESVARASEASTGGIEEAQRSAAELSALSSRLRDLVLRFRI
jgi:methyl-accepting chemotaxis protein